MTAFAFKSFLAVSEIMQLPTVIEADVEPARRLLIGLQTRSVPQKMHYRTGDEETAKRLHDPPFSTPP